MLFERGAHGMSAEDRAYICRLLDVYGGLLSEKNRDLADLYYNEDLSLAEISENCGLTRQGVRDAIKRSVAELKNFENTLGVAARTEKINSLANAVIICGDIAEAKRIAEKIIGEL